MITPRIQSRHRFFFNVEELTGSYAMIHGEDVPQRWIRPLCTCGWGADDEHRFTIEENVAHYWVEEHLMSVSLVGDEARAVAIDTVAGSLDDFARMLSDPNYDPEVCVDVARGIVAALEETGFSWD